MDDIQKQIADAIEADKKQSQYGVSRVPYHTHNNIDSPLLHFVGLADVPNSFTGFAGDVLTVNQLQTGIDFNSSLHWTGNVLEITGNISMVNGAARTISILPAAASVAGNSLTVVSGNATSGNFAGGDMQVKSGNGSGTQKAGSIFLTVGTAGASGNVDGGDIVFTPGTPHSSGNIGNIYLNAGSLATTASGGFPLLPTMSGTPTGTPPAGALVYDTSANKLWVYNGAAWKFTAFT